MTIPIAHSTTTSPARSFDVTPVNNSGLPAADSQAFMAILLAQMKYQNPLQPMDDKEVIAQMAQLNSLQELQNINATLQRLVQLAG